jgi:hypothetical protein
VALGGRAGGFQLTEQNAGPIAAICRRLDGLPLAIELAAARTTLLNPDELAARLARALDTLVEGPRDVAARQRTLRATIDWSHQLLTPAEAQAFARLAVFAGGATIDAAEQVTEAELEALEGLVDKQLLMVRRGSRAGQARLVMLETVREYAGERLAEDPNDSEVHRRHCLHFLALAEEAESRLFTHAEAEWLPRLDVEIDNLRAAFGWGLANDPTLALRLAGFLAVRWERRGNQVEGLQWLTTALDAAGDEAPIADRARARRGRVWLLTGAGASYDWQGSREAAQAEAVEALALSRAAGDPAAIAAALLAQANLYVAESLPQPRRLALAREALDCAREAGDDSLVARSLSETARSLPPEHAMAEIEEAAAALRKAGDWRLLSLYADTAYNAIKRGNPQQAKGLLEQALPLAHALGDPLVLAYVLGNVGMEAVFNGDLDRARTAFEDQIRLCSAHTLWGASEGLSGLAAIETCGGDLGRAARLLGAATATGPWDTDADVAEQLEQQFFAPARAAYGKRRWNEQQAGGAELSFDEAIAFALNSDRPDS